MDQVGTPGTANAGGPPAVETAVWQPAKPVETGCHRATQVTRSAFQRTWGSRQRFQSSPGRRGEAIRLPNSFVNLHQRTCVPSASGGEACPAIAGISIGCIQSELEPRGIRITKARSSAKTATGNYTAYVSTKTAKEPAAARRLRAHLPHVQFVGLCSSWTFATCSSRRPP